MPSVKKESFGKIPQGESSLYTLANDHGTVVKITDYGATITSILVTDRNENLVDVVLGFDNIGQYVEPHPFFGGLIGRYANRIAEAVFTIKEQKYTLEKNAGINNLHGGLVGFDKRMHIAETYKTEDTSGVMLKRISPHLESGFPGNLFYKAYYTLTNNDELIITYEATTDQTTHVNLTNHSYFNLAGEGGGDVLETELTILADRITILNKNMIPTGDFLKTEGSPFDFRRPKTIGKDIDSEDALMKLTNGYDHNFVLSRHTRSLELAASAYHPRTGIEMDLYTTEPAVQFYTANSLDGSIIGKSGRPYKMRNAFCLETQHFPDSPNKKDFPTTILEKGDVYQSQTVYQFGVR